MQQHFHRISLKSVAPLGKFNSSLACAVRNSRLVNEDEWKERKYVMQKFVFWMVLILALGTVTLSGCVVRDGYFHHPYWHHWR
jgi:hypothetical protein